MFNPRKFMGYYDPRYPALDPTTAHYEFNSYCECCYSLGIEPKLGRFMAYQRYFSQYFNEEKN